MGMLDKSIHDAKLLGWALLFSVANGAMALGLAGALGGGTLHWYQGVVGGAVLGPALTMLFETPLRAVVRWIIQIPYCGWILAMVPIAMRFVMSWPAVMVANHVMASRASTGQRSLAQAPPPASASPPVPPPAPPAPASRPLGRRGSGCDACAGPGSLGSGDGKCAWCHGTGKDGNVLNAMAASLAGTSQDCQRCSGSGTCRACSGTGDRA